MIRDGAILVRRAKVLVVQSLLERSKVVAVMVAVCPLLHVYINGVVVLVSREEDRIISGMIVGIVSG
jgi:hypothetical protein